MADFDLWLNMTGLGDVSHALTVCREMSKYYSLKLVGGQEFSELASFVVPSAEYVQGEHKIHRRAWLEEITTLSFHTTDYLFMSLFDRQATPLEKSFPTLAKGPKKSNKIAICPYTTSAVREMPPDVFEAVRKWCEQNGFELIVVGKTMQIKHNSEVLISYLPPGIRIDGLKEVFDKSLVEVTQLFSECAAIVGVDSGLLHLAAFTDTPVVVGFTTVSPIHRLPWKEGVLGRNCRVVVPKSECYYCQNRLPRFLRNYRTCLFGHRNCCFGLKGTDFIAALANAIGGKKPDGRKLTKLKLGTFFDQGSFLDSESWKGRHPQLPSQT